MKILTTNVMFALIAEITCFKVVQWILFAGWCEQKGDLDRLADLYYAYIEMVITWFYVVGDMVRH